MTAFEKNLWGSMFMALGWLFLYVESPWVATVFLGAALTMFTWAIARRGRE